MATAATGVRVRGCSSASRRKNRPSRAIAWYTRGVTRMTRLRKPNVEMLMPAAMSVRPVGPNAASIASAAGALLAASPPTPSACR